MTKQTYPISKLHMVKLNLPSYELQIRTEDGQSLIYDIFRKKFVVLTPEEWVRQHFLHYLVDQLSYPKSLIKVESGIKYNQMDKRSDIVVYDRQAKPYLLVECKSAQVPLTGKVFEQLSLYNRSFKARYLVITNGLKHYCCSIDYLTNTYEFQSQIPSWIVEH